MTQTSFSLAPDDLPRLQRIVAKRVREHVGTLNLPFFVQVVIWMLASLGAFTLLKMWQVNREATTPFMYVAALLMLSFLGAAIVLPWATQKLLAKFVLSSHGTFLSEQRIALVADGLEISNASGFSQMQWSGFIAKDEDVKNYYLFVDALQALVIPKATAEKLGPDFESHFRRIGSEA